MAELDRFSKEDQELCSPPNDEEKEKKPRVSSEKEKEKTKIRERHRRSITTKILAGLRKHGNYNLPPRADINDVLRALAMEAGWIVEADGTTYKNTQQAGCPSRSTLVPQQLGHTNRPSLTSPGALTSPSLTPTPSSSSLNSLGGFNCAPPASGIDPIDQTGGDCSTTASPRYISSNSGMGLLSPCPSPLIPARAEGLSNMQYANSIFLGGSVPHGYMLNDEGDVLGLREDRNTPQITSYMPGDMIESRDTLPVETPSSSLSGVPIVNTSVSPLHSSFYCAQQLGAMVYNNNPRNGVSPSMIYNAQQHHPFLLEARASNQNTPIGSPQGMGAVSPNLLYTQPHPFLQESRASNQNTPIGSPQPNGGTF